MNAIEALVGRTILAVNREGLWLELVVTGEPSRFQFAGGRVRVDLVCERCRETRLTEVVKDARGEQGFCSVCSHAWWLTRASVATHPAPVQVSEASLLK